MTTRLKVLHVVGARPQFPKLGAVMRAVQRANEHGPVIDEWLAHTGQHYDEALSEVFFEELEIRAPDFNLGVGSGTNSAQTAAGIERVAEVIGKVQPDAVVVYGDTNATLAGAIAANQLKVRPAHVEAGVRTGNLFQAEELNRVIVDRVARWKFCCTEQNLETLSGEGLRGGSEWVGDTMLDNYLHFLPHADRGVLEKLKLESNGFVLCTIHRAENTDDPVRLNSIVDALIRIQSELWPIVLPLHPRTRKEIGRLGRLEALGEAGVKLVEPLGFLSLQALLEHSRLVLTDSGGLQREAYFAGRRCVVPWEYASWPELVAAGWVGVGSIEATALFERTAAADGPSENDRESGRRTLFGTGDAGDKIVAGLLARADAPLRDSD